MQEEEKDTGPETNNKSLHHTVSEGTLRMPVSPAMETAAPC